MFSCQSDLWVEVEVSKSVLQKEDVADSSLRKAWVVDGRTADGGGW